MLVAMWSAYFTASAVTIPAFALHHSSEQLEIEFQDGQLLVDVVVQLACDAGALRFLRGEQLSAHFTDAHHALAQRPLRAPTPRAMHDESDNQRGLDGQQGRSTEDVPTIAIPGAGLAELDDTAGRQQPAVERPPIELPHIEHVLVASHLLNRNACG